MTDGGASALPAYDAGLLPKPRGASDDWWQDAIRQILASAHEHYANHAADLCQGTFAPPGREDASARSTGPGNVSSGARIVDRSAPDVGDDLASAVAAAVMGLEWTGRGLDAGQPVDEDEADRRHGSVQTVVSDVLARLGEPRAGGETPMADHIAALAVASEDDGRELTLAEVLQAGFKRFGYVHPAEAAREACETIAAGPLPTLAPGLPPDRIARAIFGHPLMQAVERSASERWLTKAEQATVAGAVARFAPAGSGATPRGEVAKWRNDALEKAVEILRRYEPFADDATRDILALRDASCGDRGEAEALHRIYSQFIVNRGDLSDGEAIEAIRQVCEGAGKVDC